MQIPSSLTPIAPSPLPVEPRPLAPQRLPEAPLPQDASDLQHLFPAAEEAPAAPVASPTPTPSPSPAADPGFAPGARQKLNAGIWGAGNSLLNEEHRWPEAWTNPAPPTLTAPVPAPSGAEHVWPFAGMQMGAAAMPQAAVPPAGPGWAGRMKASLQKVWDFGMSGGLIGHARRQHGAARPAQAAPPAGPLQVRVQVGDLTATPTQALITNINSEGQWYGAVDGAIQRAGGNQFHQQAAEVLDRSGLQEGQTVLARSRQPHSGAFQDVVFVVDDGRKPLREIVLEGLRSADRAGLQSVALPAMRTGLMAGPAGPGPALREMAAGIRQFQAEGPASVRDIQVVVYRDAAMARELQGALA